MISNKKVLLICKESFSFPLFFLAKKLLTQGNEVSAFFIHPEESYYNKCAYNENTYFNFKENLPEVKLYDLKDFCVNFNTKPSVDYKYLESVERDYTHFKNLNLQLTVSQLTTRHYHNRIYFDYSSFDQNLNFIEFGYKRVKEVISRPEFAYETSTDINVFRQTVYKWCKILADENAGTSMQDCYFLCCLRQSTLHRAQGG